MSQTNGFKGCQGVGIKTELLRQCCLFFISANSLLLALPPNREHLDGEQRSWVTETADQ